MMKLSCKLALVNSLMQLLFSFDQGTKVDETLMIPLTWSYIAVNLHYPRFRLRLLLKLALHLIMTLKSKRHI